MKKILTSQVSLVIAFAALVMTFQNCSQDGLEAIKSSTAASSSGEVLDTGSHNQKPHLSCLLTNSADANSKREIDSDSRTDTFTDAYIEGSSLTIDCQSSTDETNTSELKFRLSENYDAENPIFNDITGDSIVLNLNTPGRLPMALEVEDAQGLKTIKTFTLVVRCANAQAPTLNTNGVSVSPTGRLNYFNYSINPNSLGNGKNFSFSWDFNGDSVYDPFSLDNPNEFWSEQTTASDIYTIFANERTIGLKVRNECQLESYFKVKVDFPMDNIPRTPAAEATVKPYYYLQADIEGSPTTEQRVNGDYLSTMYPEDVKTKRIDCDYNFQRNGQLAGFTMKGHNWYKSQAKNMDDVAPFIHGMQIHVSGIKDSGAMGLQTFTDAFLDVSNYKASAADDGMIQESYDRAALCSLTIRIERMKPQAPCADNEKKLADFSEIDVIRIRGEFDCPRLSENNNHIAARNGKFFCEVAPVDMCVGGGGGGGGTPPPEQ